MSKEDFKGISSIEEIAFIVWWNEFMKKHIISTVDIQETARMAFIAGCKIHINMRKEDE